ncbi:MAG: lysozyme [Actinophytocola sp.]|nr:lysozyme [Actinophytocola sp.]
MGVTLLALAGAFVAGPTVPAVGAADRVNSDAAEAAAERADHAMGSQIAKHEGAGGGERPGDSGSQSGTKSADDGVLGIDVSRWQGKVDWQYWWDKGKRFAYIKATEGVSYTSPTYRDQYDGAAGVGMIRGAYHFALPDVSGGAKQAEYFVDNGGQWTSDGKTLPGVIDLEYNPYGESCYGKTQSQMATWIKDFADTYHRRTSRDPVIYTSNSWWQKCVGSARSFAATSPLWVARYSDSVGPLPGDWDYYTFWQYSNEPIDQNRFNGSMARLKVLARSDSGSRR